MCPGHPPNRAAALFERAKHRFEAGREDEAYEICAGIVAQGHDHLPALFLLGQLDLQRRRYDRAVGWLRRGLRLAPRDVALNYYLGVACSELKLHDEAIAALWRATQIKPDFAPAHYQAGFQLLVAGAPEAALPWLGRAADLAPENFDYQRVLGGALLRAREAERAVGVLERALALSPAAAEVHRNLAMAYRDVQRLEDAQRAARQAVALSPESVEAHLVLASVLTLRNQLDEALDVVGKAIAIAPNADLPHDESGSLLVKLGRVEEALAAFRRAASLAPADWAHNPRSRLAFVASFDPDHDAQQILAAAKQWGSAHATPLLHKQRPHSNDKSPVRRLRLGYVSPDFRQHAQTFFTLPVLRHHDRDRFEIICYSSVRQPDRYTEALRAHASEWHDVSSLDDAALAQRIRADRIDVLVDLTMHMTEGRLKTFAEKPAPVQISWLAYPGTTGVDAIDYRISDVHLDPPGCALPYSEQTLRLPDCFWCYEPRSEEPAVGPLPALRAGHVTFGCLNDFTKVNRGVLGLWARVLAAVPDSRLIMLAPPGSARSFVSAELGRGGIAAGRIEYVDRQPHSDYLRTFGRIDVGLDCIPYNGHTTTLDSCWMGVPVATLVGSTVCGRAGLCMNENLGLRDLVAHRPEELVAIAESLSRDRARLGALRAGLRDRLRASPLMDAPRFVRNLEAAYRGAWTAWCRGG